jgi:hypothetical protein
MAIERYEGHAFEMQRTTSRVWSSCCLPHLAAAARMFAANRARGARGFDATQPRRPSVPNSRSCESPVSRMPSVDLRSYHS